MTISIIAVGQKMPEWVNAACNEYSKRFPASWPVKLIEIPMARRSKNTSIAQLKSKETDSLLAETSNQDFVIALDERGDNFTTTQLAQKISSLRDQGQSISLLVGGPDGLDQRCQQRANASWSLSRLTLPHPLVRIVLIEQLYRVYSLLNGHPYHR